MYVIICYSYPLSHTFTTQTSTDCQYMAILYVLTYTHIWDPLVYYNSVTFYCPEYDAVENPGEFCGSSS